MTKTLLFLLIYVLTSPPCYSQSDSLVDVFPLAVGNQWLYRYQRVDSVPMIPPATLTIDTGSASFRITGKSVFQDSTRWQFEERRHLQRKIHHFTPPQPDSFSVVQDSSTFEIVERHQGQHWVYRTGPPNYYVELGVFPFNNEFTETTFVYRYRPVDSNGTTTFLSQVPFGDVTYFLTFKRGVGLTRVYGYWLVLSGASVYCTHHMVSSILLSTEDDRSQLQPLSPVLSQNYPNPFNPSTTIEYSLPHEAIVSLKLFDVLGREVMMLVESKQEAGAYRVMFNAENLSSGVYFYRLNVEGFVATRKLLYLR